MTDAFQTGDVVRLRSGGPLMTVTGVSPCKDGNLSVNWFHDGELRTSYLSGSCLVKVDPPAWAMPTPDQVATARERLGTTWLTHKTVIVTDPPEDGYDTTGSPVFVPKRPSDGGEITIENPRSHIEPGWYTPSGVCWKCGSFGPASDSKTQCRTGCDFVKHNRSWDAMSERIFSLPNGQTERFVWVVERHRYETKDGRLVMEWEQVPKGSPTMFADSPIKYSSMSSIPVEVEPDATR